MHLPKRGAALFQSIVFFQALFHVGRRVCKNERLHTSGKVATVFVRYIPAKGMTQQMHMRNIKLLQQTLKIAYALRNGVAKRDKQLEHSEGTTIE
jgi:hypothetical protein